MLSWIKSEEFEQQNKEEESEEGGVSRAGYVFVLERKAFGSAWAKHYCVYRRDSRLLTLVPYNQINVKAVRLLLFVALAQR